MLTDFFCGHSYEEHFPLNIIIFISFIQSCFSLEFFDKVNKHITQVPRMQYVYASAYLCSAVCVLAHVHVFMHANVCVCVQTVWVGVCV